MSDMSQVIVPKSDQINADDLIGRDMTITIRDVQIRGGQEQPVSIYFEGSDKAFRPCKSMSRVLVYCWGADAKQYIGRSLTLYRDASVKWGGMAVGGIRISHASHIDKDQTMVLAESKASRKPYTVKKLAALAKPTPVENDPADDKNAADLIARINAAASAGKLDTFLARPQVIEWRAFFRANRPDLSEQVEAVCGPATVAQDDPFGGPDESDRGEAHTATTTDEATAAEIIKLIGDEKTDDALTGFLLRRQADIEALPEELQNRVTEAEAAKRAEWA